MSASPAIAIRGIRQTIPSGYVLGRASSGDGQVELIPFTVQAAKLSAAFIPIAQAAITTTGSGIANAGGTLSVEWNAGTVTTLSGFGLSGGTLTAIGEWNAGSVTAVATGLVISGKTLVPAYQAGTLTTIGTGLTLNAGGTLSAVIPSQSVTAAGNGLGLNSGTMEAVAGQILAGTVSGTITIAPGSGTSDVIINMPTASGTVTLSASPSFQFQRVLLHIKQGSTPQSVAMNTGFVFVGGSYPASYTATASASVRDILGLYSPDGTHWVVDLIMPGVTI